MSVKVREKVTANIGDNVTLLDDSTMTLECNVKGNPRPVITWTKSGRLLTNGGRIGINEKLKSLTITNVVEEDKGLYVCSASNIRGSVSASSTVEVIGKKMNL